MNKKKIFYLIFFFFQDLNMAEKFQLHVMAITRQSIYYCDLCRKSCAGVVRSKVIK